MMKASIPRRNPPAYQIKLVSVDQNVHFEQWSLNHRDLDLDTDMPWSIEMCRLKGGKQEGVDLIVVDNGVLKFSVIPTRGMSVFKVVHEDLRLGWKSPVREIVHPKFMRLESEGGTGWLAGFNEWLVRCGLEFAGHPGTDNGRFLTLHGKIANIPASEVQVVIDEGASPRIRIRGKVPESSFNGPDLELWTEISTVLGSNHFRIEDEVINRAAKDQEFTLIYHANFGPPLLEPGSRLYGTIDRVFPFDTIAATDVHRWNMYAGPKVNHPESVFCMYPYADEEGNCHFLLCNAKGDKAVGFHYPKEQMPYFTQWKNENSDGYVTGLEPGTSFPNNRSVERKFGRIPVLGPEQRRRFTIDYELYSGKEGVTTAIQKIEAMATKEVEIVEQVIGK